MFDLRNFPYQSACSGEEEEKEAGQMENEDYYVCKLPDFGAVIKFKNCWARSKIRGRRILSAPGRPAK